jgi:osomolarity two-component system, response regulator SKN7
MPNLDGVSACHLIRQLDRTPIVAMTSNIRSDDIQMYFQHGRPHFHHSPKTSNNRTYYPGMDDVLPKPFTRKSLLDMLDKHLSHLKKLAPGMEPPPSTTASSVPHSSTAHSIKDEASSPAQSPAGSLGNWQSPSHYPGVSPVHTNIPHQYAPTANHSPYITSPHTPLTATRPCQQQQPPQSPHQQKQQQQQQQQQQEQQQQHRRQLSEMTGGASDMNGYNKRQRIYGQPAQNMGMPSEPQ